MNAKLILAVLLTFAAVPASFAEHYGRGSENSPFASRPSVSATASVAQSGRASAYGDVAKVEKNEVKARLATAAAIPGRA
jgi:hypothetical protein